MLIAYTDYPLLKHEEGKEAPIRQVLVGAYDGDKYVDIYYCGEKYNIKTGYLYEQSGRAGQVKCVSLKQLKHNTNILNMWKQQLEKD